MTLFVTGILVILLLIAAWNDICYFRIPNELIVTGITIAILTHIIIPHSMGESGIAMAFIGMAVSFLLFSPLFLMHVMGAGDIKLMVMIGAFVGPIDILIVTLYVMLAGGVLAIGIVLFRDNNVLRKIISNIRTSLHVDKFIQSNFSIAESLTTSTEKLPYGVAIAGGTFFYLTFGS